MFKSILVFKRGQTWRSGSLLGGPVSWQPCWPNLQVPWLTQLWLMKVVSWHYIYSSFWQGLILTCNSSEHLAPEAFVGIYLNSLGSAASGQTGVLPT